MVYQLTRKTGFQMRKSITELLAQHKQEVDFRTDRTQAPFGTPQLSEAAVFFDLAEKTRAVAHGGLPLIHQIAIASGLIEALNAVQRSVRRVIDW